MNTLKLATCPTCGKSGEFVFLGEQHWPPHIAERLGVPAVIRLYSCPNCQSTISEPDLLPFQAEQSSPASAFALSDSAARKLNPVANALRRGS